ncbi:hypothetical protein [Streptomyces sp. NPDC020362]|uniref:hypothetical protein n=1 Tax=unclassified Streptomyces TaxID=2593676 RepID=UPI0034005431
MAGGRGRAGDADSRGGAPAGAGGAGAAPAVSCAWPTVVRPGRLNLAFPEAHATYRLTSCQPGKGDRIVVEGTYPSARFTSLTSYDGQGAPVDALAGFRIAPSLGSRNPFAVPDAGTHPAHHRYRVTPKPSAAAGSGGNTLAATTHSAASPHPVSSVPRTSGRPWTGTGAAPTWSPPGGTAPPTRPWPMA